MDDNFIDGEGREIVIEDIGTGIQAVHNGDQVGLLELWEPEDPDGRQGGGVYRVYQIHVWKPEYRRAGIGFEMYRRAFEIYGKLGVADQDPMSDNKPTDDGWAILRRAIANGWVYPFETEKPEYGE